MHREICLWTTPTAPHLHCASLFFPPFRKESEDNRKSFFPTLLFASSRRDGNRRLTPYICSVFTAQQQMEKKKNVLTCYCRAPCASQTESSLGRTRPSAGPVDDAMWWQVNNVRDILFYFFVSPESCFFSAFCKTVLLHFNAPKVATGTTVRR